jgi:hypothetical protein
MIGIQRSGSNLTIDKEGQKLREGQAGLLEEIRNRI